MLLFGYRIGQTILSLQSNPRGVRSGEANIVALISGRPGLAQTPIFHSFLELFVVFALIHPPSSVAGSTPPPIEENAYCGRGDVSKFKEKDGPAQLPTSCYYAGMDGTPSPGKQIRVDANSDLFAAVQSAKCGDTLLLAAGASFEIKELPAKKCDDQHYITIRTARPIRNCLRKEHAFHRLGPQLRAYRAGPLTPNHPAAGQAYADAGPQRALLGQHRRPLSLYRRGVGLQARALVMAGWLRPRGQTA